MKGNMDNYCLNFNNNKLLIRWKFLKVNLKDEKTLGVYTFKMFCWGDTTTYQLVENI